MSKSYKLFIENDTGGEYSDYTSNLQLPFNITENADEKYDTGSLTLHKINRETPFKHETKVRIDIYQDNIFINKYSMMVESDLVKSRYIGIRKYYDHEITLIEITKKLDRIYLPDFTVTNPATKSIHNPFRDSGSKWTLSTKATSFSFDDVTNLGYPSTFYNRSVSTTSLSFDNNLSTNYAFLNQNGGKIILPTPTFSGSSVTVTDKHHIQYEKTTSGNYNNQDATYTDSITTAIVVYSYRDKNKASTAFQSFLRREINLSDSSEVSYEILNYQSKRTTKVGDTHYFIIGVNGSEHIELKTEVFLRIKNASSRPILKAHIKDRVSILMPLADSTIPFLKRTTAMFTNYYETFNITKDDSYLMYAGILDDWIKDVGTFDNDLANDYIDQLIVPYFYDVWNRMQYNVTSCTYDGEPKNFMYEHKNRQINTNYSPYYTYSDFSLGDIKASFQSVADLSAETAPEITILGDIYYNTIKDVLDKINLMIEPSDRFKLKETMGEIMTTTVPEKVYTKRNVSEILFELGTLFSAYPYLDENNYLSFIKVNPLDNNVYEDVDTDENMKMDGDNATNSYVTNISNMVNTPDDFLEQYSYWPTKEAFSRANGKWTEKLITPDNTAIEIPNSNGIYYLKYIKVKNCLKTTKDPVSGETICDPNTILDLTDFCPEETYYNSLYTQFEDALSNTHKSNCIYWTKGSNKITIDGLERSEKVAIWGEVAAERYKIHRAVLAAALAQVNSTIKESDINLDTLSYLYQICYIDNMSGMIKTSKFNQDNINDILSNYNQTDNNIEGKEWMNSSQINILRRGNNDLDKVVYFNDFQKLPKLGEIKKILNSTDYYLADAISFTFDNNICSASINYTKFYNKIDPAVSISKDYRQYEIYGKESVSRDIHINRYVYLDTNADTLNTYKDHRFILTGGLSTNKNNIPDFMLLFFKDSDKKPIKFHTMTSTANVLEETVSGILAPVKYVTSGNSVILEAAMMDNYAAGYYQDINENIGYYNLNNEYISSGAKGLKEVRYVDDLGKAEYVSVYLVYGNNSAFFNIDSFPKSSMVEETANLKTQTFVLDYEQDIPIKKDNREKLNFIYQIHFLTHDSTIKWNPALCKYFFNEKDTILNQGNSPVKYYFLKDNITNDKHLPLYVSPITGELTLNTNKIATILNTTINNTSIVSTENAVINSPFRSLALAYSNEDSYEIILHKDVNHITGATYTPHPIYFNFYKNRV